MKDEVRHLFPQLMLLTQLVLEYLETAGVRRLFNETHYSLIVLHLEVGRQSQESIVDS